MKGEQQEGKCERCSEKELLLAFAEVVQEAILSGAWFVCSLGQGCCLQGLGVWTDFNTSMMEAPGCLRELVWRRFCTFPMRNSLRQACGGGEGRGETEMKSLSGYTWPT